MHFVAVDKYQSLKFRKTGFDIKTVSLLRAPFCLVLLVELFLLQLKAVRMK